MGNTDANDAYMPGSSQFPDLAQKAASMYRNRRLRERFLPKAIFAEPGWDMLLDLFVASEHKRDVSISSACVAACVPPTTALRWIAMLEERDLVCRERDASDHRRTFLRLTPQGYRQVLNFLLADWLACGR